MLVNCIEPKMKSPPVPEHLNFILCSDLSNRLTIYAKPIEDTVLVADFLDFYYPEVYLANNRDYGHADKINVALLNGMNVKKFNLNMNRMRLDLAKYNANDRIKYLIGQLEDFESDKKNFREEVNMLYSNVIKNVQGADIYGLFKSELTTVQIRDSTKEKFRNIMILFTDGYIEYGSKQREGNKTYYLNKQLINEFRDHFIKRKDSSSMQEFFRKSGYGLVPIINPKLEYLEVFAIEFMDRSLTNGNGRIYPTDFEILKLFWEDWMLQSKVKSYKIYKTFNDGDDFKTELIKFIEQK